MSPPTSRPSSSAEVREHLARALEVDLVGPFLGPEAADTATEELPLPPSRWYLTGFIVPQADPTALDPTAADEDLGAGGDDDDAEEQPPQERGTKRPGRLPSSIGLSVFLPPGEGDSIRATVSYADYQRVEHEEAVHEGAARASARKVTWRRLPKPSVSLDVPVDAELLRKGLPVPGSRGLVLVGELAEPSAPGLPEGTRALALFLVNRREPAGPPKSDEQCAFQVRLRVQCDDGLVARPNQRDLDGDEEERISDLQFRERMEYAVGHGVSVQVEDQGELVTAASTSWLPRADVLRVITREEPVIETGMEALAELADGSAAVSALEPIATRYGAWISEQRKVDVGKPRRKQTQATVLDTAEEARKRIADGVALLGRDAEVLEAFRIANRAMAMAARQRSPERYASGAKPTWRLFQLAFVLMNLGGLASPGHPDRERVDLIFFPTGGGKTEAYLGLIAFLLVLRRLRGASRPDGGLGVAILLRYTLRLLTLDQLARAATLVCALELLRRADPRLGKDRFSIGLWVGRSATANRLKEVAEAITAYKANPSDKARSPFPLTDCPWCGHPITCDSFELKPNVTHPEAAVVSCPNWRGECPFSSMRGKSEGLPVLFVDEQIYRELPGFLIATVDKFALLPWRGETGMLFGQVRARDASRFYGHADPAAPPPGAQPLGGLAPPDLVVQDELHLISGPLGSMVGLYETAIEALSSGPRPDGPARKPKIIASTATVRRARQQIRALYGRLDFSVFPPPGIDDSETYFAQVDRKSPGRLYLGVAAPGRPMKAVLLRVYVALLSAAERCYDPLAGASQPADAYMTLAGYFNSLRELGGMRRLVEDEVRTRATKAKDKRPVGFAGPNPWLASRDVQLELLELTSRESTAKIAAAKRQLAQPHSEKDHVDVLLASNMISVGVDIERLGLMVVAGQPKSTSEYIQASSRVGRGAQRPGLVVTVLNFNKPRDRSHFERFVDYHRSFYRFVEATSVTPFSGPALERGLAAVLVAMTRLPDPALSPPRGAMEIGSRRQTGDRAADALARRAAGARPMSAQEANRVQATVEAQGRNLLDAWQEIVRRTVQEAGGQRCYSPWEHQGKALLFQALDREQAARGSDEEKFSAPTSMRDVEPTVPLWLERAPLGGRPRRGR